MARTIADCQNRALELAKSAVAEPSKPFHFEGKPLSKRDKEIQVKAELWKLPIEELIAAEQKAYKWLIEHKEQLMATDMNKWNEAKGRYHRILEILQVRRVRS